MKATLNDIVRERLFEKQIDLYQGKYLEAYNNVNGNYHIYYNGEIIAIVNNKENSLHLQCPQDGDKKALNLQILIRNQLRDIRKVCGYSKLSQYQP